MFIFEYGYTILFAVRKLDAEIVCFSVFWRQKRMAFKRSLDLIFLIKVKDQGEDTLTLLLMCLRREFGSSSAWLKNLCFVTAKC